MVKIKGTDITKAGIDYLKNDLFPSKDDKYNLSQRTVYGKHNLAAFEALRKSISSAATLFHCMDIKNKQNDRESDLHSSMKGLKNKYLADSINLQEKGGQNIRSFVDENTLNTRGEFRKDIETVAKELEEFIKEDIDKDFSLETGKVELKNVEIAEFDQNAVKLNKDRLNESLADLKKNFEKGDVLGKDPRSI